MRHIVQGMFKIYSSLLMKSYLQAFIESFQHTDTDLCIRLLHKIQSSEIDQSQKRKKEEEKEQNIH